MTETKVVLTQDGYYEFDYTIDGRVITIGPFRAVTPTPQITMTLPVLADSTDLSS